MNQKTIYKTAVYLRLSKDDIDIDNKNKIESNSISCQREILKSYIKSHEDLEIADIYTDDGYSGVDFHRPEFERMMRDIMEGIIDCIIVKDLSRFGRDYIEVGRFIQRIFPALLVRFIAVTDNYDSLYADRTEQAFVLPVKNFINDSYCRDISIKVRAQQNIKRQEGKCIAAFTVYGYLKDPHDRNRLIVDRYAADIVQKIYMWKKEGMSLGAIANKLNLLGILSPMEYKKSLGMRYSTGFESSRTAKWAAVSVKRILTNRVYLGYMEQGKQEKVSYKIKKRIVKPEEEWIQVKNTHEAIILKEDYDIVQELLRFDGRSSADTDTANLFSGILMCADCNAPMIKRKNTYKGREKTFYICQTKNKSLGCSRHSIEEAVLKKILLKEINAWIGIMVSYEDIANIRNEFKPDYRQIAEYNRHIERLRAEYNRYYSLEKGLLKDVERGLIDRDEYEELKSLYKQRCEELRDTIDNQQSLLKKISMSSITSRPQIDNYIESRELRELTRNLLVSMVSKVYVHEDRELDIVYRFASANSIAGERYGKK